MLGANIIVLVTCSLAFDFEFKIFCITGIANAAVFPDPVRARNRTSLPWRSSGIAFSWMSVGVIQPSNAIAFKNLILFLI